MKKLFLLLLSVFALQSASYADDDKPIEFNQLPVKAQEFIKKHFPTHKCSFAKMESDLLDKNYTVIFTNGESVEFDSSGEWKDIECKTTGVPAAIIPSQIASQIKERYPQEKFLKIERSKKYYEVKLSNGLELKFTKKFKLVEIDN